MDARSHHLPNEILYFRLNFFKYFWFDDIFWVVSIRRRQEAYDSTPLWGVEFFCKIHYLPWSKKLSMVNCLTYFEDLFRYAILCCLLETRIEVIRKQWHFHHSFWYGSNKYQMCKLRLAHPYCSHILLSSYPLIEFDRMKIRLLCPKNSIILFLVPTPLPTYATSSCFIGWSLLVTKHNILFLCSIYSQTNLALSPRAS